MSFRVRGAHLESCNCEAICPYDEPGSPWTITLHVDARASAAAFDYASP